MLPRSLPTTVALVAALALTTAGCTRQISPNTVRGDEVGAILQTKRGTVDGVRVVNVQEGDRLQNNPTGIVVGGLAGGVAGAAFGGGWGQVIAAGAGALAGATLGALAERQLTNQEALQYFITLDDGETISIVQGEGENIRAGDRVIVQYGDGRRARAILL